MIGSDILAALPSSRPGYEAPDDGVAKLNQNESPYTLRPEEREALLAELGAVSLHRYPDPGHRVVEDAVARLTGLASDAVLAGNGGNELIDLIIRTVANPGDEVLTAAPTYHLYDRFCAMNRTRLIKVPWEEGFRFPHDALARSVTSRTKLILLCRPNNPTGHLYPAEEVLRVANGFPGLVAVDEAYHDFAGDTVAAYIPGVANLAVVRTLSKAYGAAGLRFGYLLAHPDIAAAARSLQMPYGMNALTQAVALFLLSHQEIMERQRRAILAGRHDLARRLEAIEGLTVFPSATNFLLVRTLWSADALDRHLRASGIVVRNLKWDDRHLRISVGTPDDHTRLAKAIRAFAASAGA